MARRRTSTFEDLMEITAKLPWWIGILLAFISFIILNNIANMDVAPPTDLKNMTTPLMGQMFKTFAMFGQIILPIGFGFGALLSFIKQFKQRQHYTKVQAQAAPNPLLDMTWQEFEGLVSEFFRRRGYSVQQTGGNGPDGGIDIVLTKGKDKYLVQCKQWKAYKVGVQIVRELHGVMAAKGAAGGFVVTAGEFTTDAKEFAKGLNINLFNGARLQQMIREKNISAPLESGEERDGVDVPLIPRCPLCGESLVLRTAKKGPKAGQQFWGCSRFPHCRGTRSL